MKLGDALESFPAGHGQILEVRCSERAWQRMGYLSWDANSKRESVLWYFWGEHSRQHRISSANVLRWFQVGKVQKIERRPKWLGHQRTNHAGPQRPCSCLGISSLGNPLEPSQPRQAAVRVFITPLNSGSDPLHGEDHVLFFLYLPNQTLHSSGHIA